VGLPRCLRLAALALHLAAGCRRGPRAALALLLVLPAACQSAPAAPHGGAAVVATGADTPFLAEATGRDYRWGFRYAGGDGALGTPDDVFGAGDLHVPAHARVLLQLESEDYLYLFRVADLDLSQIASPELDFSLEFESGRPGSYEMVGDEVMCGRPHPEFRGRLVVLPPPEMRAWLARAPAAPSALGPDAGGDRP